eukprot:g2246.t1
MRVEDFWASMRPKSDPCWTALLRALTMWHVRRNFAGAACMLRHACKQGRLLCGSVYTCPHLGQETNLLLARKALQFLEGRAADMRSVLQDTGLITCSRIATPQQVQISGRTFTVTIFREGFNILVEAHCSSDGKKKKGRGKKGKRKKALPGTIGLKNRIEEKPLEQYLMILSGAEAEDLFRWVLNTPAALKDDELFVKLLSRMLVLVPDPAKYRQTARKRELVLGIQASACGAANYRNITHVTSTGVTLIINVTLGDDRNLILQAVVGSAPNATTDLYNINSCYGLFLRKDDIVRCFRDSERDMRMLRSKAWKIRTKGLLARICSSLALGEAPAASHPADEAAQLRTSTLVRGRRVIKEHTIQARKTELREQQSQREKVNETQIKNFIAETGVTSRELARRYILAAKSMVSDAVYNFYAGKEPPPMKRNLKLTIGNRRALEISSAKTFIAYTLQSHWRRQEAAAYVVALKEDIAADKIIRAARRRLFWRNENATWIQSFFRGFVARDTIRSRVLCPLEANPRSIPYHVAYSSFMQAQKNLHIGLSRRRVPRTLQRQRMRRRELL